MRNQVGALFGLLVASAAMAQGPGHHLSPAAMMKTTTPAGESVDAKRHWVNGQALVSIAYPDELAMRRLGPERNRERDAALRPLIERVLGDAKPRGLTPGGWHVVTLPAGVTPDKADAYFRGRFTAAMASFRNPAGVALLPAIRVSPNHLVLPTSRTEPDDPFYPRQWRYARIQAAEAWAQSTGSSSTAPVYVAVLDTGIFPHADLVDNLDVARGRNFVVSPSSPTPDAGDVDGHGTFDAGIVGETGNNGIGGVGVNWSVKLISMKMMEGNAPSPVAASNAALQYVLDLKQAGLNIRVVLAGWRNNPGSTVIPAQRDAIAALAAEEIVVVCASGNERSDDDVTPVYPAGYGSGVSPLGNVIAVASSDHDDHVSYFSNWGSDSVDLAAPGSDIYSTYLVPAYLTMSGTSAAAAHVAGAAALLLAKEPTLTAAQVKARITGTVDTCPAYAGKVKSNGRLNLNAMLAGAPLTTPHCAP